MRLSSIKLAGFKSFVDATTISFPGQRVAIVGPNGCGKSNVIDAIRWVMGESRAKYLRGESMADVIFNGTNTRKPVALASVELIFDNSDHSLGGEYAKYSQISVKRVATRDGQSSYYLNNTRCRRRDVTDLFLGTGLGPRSYAVIEQGTISKIIEARPEDLRVYLEEVSGISKYKERRRETEQRMQSTRENLERVADIQQELAKQLNHLASQARAAERFKQLKTEERHKKSLLLALQWQQYNQELQSKSNQLNQHHNQLVQLRIEMASLQERNQHAHDQLKQLQNSLSIEQHMIFETSSELQKQQQKFEYEKEKSQQNQQEIAKTKQFLIHVERQIAEDSQQLTLKSDQLSELKPELERLQRAAESMQEQLQQSETVLQAKQQQYDAFQQQYAQRLSQAEVAKNQIHHLELRMKESRERLQSLENEEKLISQEKRPLQLEQLESQSKQIQEECTRLEIEKKQFFSQIESNKEIIKHQQKELEKFKTELQQLKGKYSSLETLQNNVISSKDQAISNWLKQARLDHLPSLGRMLEVSPGWEKAVEIVLQDFLQAFCLETTPKEDLAKSLIHLKDRQVQFVYSATSTQQEPLGLKLNVPCLAEHVKGHKVIRALLQTVYIAEDEAKALEMLEKLPSSASVITPQGVWLGQGWMRYGMKNSQQSGIFAREKELKTIQAQMEQTQLEIVQHEALLEQQQKQLKELEQCLTLNQETLLAQQQQLTQHMSKMEWERKEQERIEKRWQTCIETQEKIKAQSHIQEQELIQQRELWQQSVSQLEQDLKNKEMLQQERQKLQESIQSDRTHSREKRDEFHRMSLKLQQLQQEINNLSQNQNKQLQQKNNAVEKLSQLETEYEKLIAPFTAYQDKIKSLQEHKSHLESRLSVIKNDLSHIEQTYQEFQQQQQSFDQQHNQIKQAHDQLQLEQQTLYVRCQTIEEQFAQLEEALSDRLTDLSVMSYSISSLETEVAALKQKLDRLGAVNLAAIEEHQEVAQRKETLDSQAEDLKQALQSLENAIRHIDRETRDRFKETYDLVNQHFSELFPTIFGGGEASLKLESEDLLESGVYVVARPPGKRNTSIHLLSGGEKALTALALVFSFFKLNPAPFCLLDEVDAPLDDANVGRFCSLVRAMSQSVQFIFISHNKIAIEMGEQLIGVTMREPGVSRLVSVDVQQALEMVD